MTIYVSEILRTKVEALKNMLVAMATGGACSSNDDYAGVRGDLINQPLVKDKIPRFVHTCRTLDEFWGFIKPRFDHYHERREFLREAFDPVLTFLERTSATPSDEILNGVLKKVDSVHVQSAWQKALDRRSSDPEGAITSARTLLEAVLKHILGGLSIPYDDKSDLPKLYVLVAKNLNLSPSQHTEMVFRQILGGCHAVVEGLGALRNKLGDAHGAGKVAVRPVARHAELAVNLSGAMSTFLIATWEARKE